MSYVIQVTNVKRKMFVCHFKGEYSLSAALSFSMRFNSKEEAIENINGDNELKKLCYKEDEPNFKIMLYSVAKKYL